jgi:hypothetical protein
MSSTTRRSGHSAHSGETIVYDNIFNVAESTQHQSLTFAVHDPAAGQDYTHANSVVSKLELLPARSSTQSPDRL